MLIEKNNISQKSTTLSSVLIHTNENEISLKNCLMTTQLCQF